MSDGPRKLLVVANETLTGDELLDAVRSSVGDSEAIVVVIAPVNAPREGYVVYDNTRRAAAGRRLDRTLTGFREAGIAATGHVVDNDPLTAVKDAIAIEEPDELIVSTHPEATSGWRRRNLLDEIRKAAGAIPVQHVVSDVAARVGAENVLVIANETVLGEPLLDRIREKARSGAGRTSFLIISPQSDPEQGAHPEAERRLRQMLTRLRAEGIEAHGQVAHPGSVHGGDARRPRRARRRDPRLDVPGAARLVVASPRPRGKAREGGEGAGRARRRRAEQRRRGGARMSAHAEAHHGPPIANQSSRVSSTVLGMFLFIASEAMLFGSFFTMYFFVRVVNPDAEPWPLPPYHLPVFVAGVNTAVLLTSSFTMHWALQSIKRGNRAGMKAGLVLTILMGLAFLLTQMLEYARIGFNPSDGAFGSIFFGLTGLHGAHVFVGLTLLTVATVRAFRGHFTPEHHHGVEIPGIYWHFVDVMWIVVYASIYLL